MIYVVDVETTGMDHATDRVVEFGAVPVRIIEAAPGSDLKPSVEIGEGASSLVYPGIPIPPQASAVHHLIDDDVEAAPPLGRAINHVLGPLWESDPDPIFVAHNGRFDKGFLHPLHKARWIDTLYCAMHLWPDAPSHSNQVLRYWLGLPVPRDLPTHRALGDAIVTAHLFAKMLEQKPVDELIRLSGRAALLARMPIGDHYGKPWSEVPTGFLDWMMTKFDKWDPHTKFTLKFELKRRQNILVEQEQNR